MPMTLLFIISVRIFLISCVMIGRTSDGVVFFSEGCRPWMVELSVLCKSGLRSVFHFCLYFIFFLFHFTYLSLWSFFVYLFWSSTAYRLVGLVVRRSPRERKIPGSNPACDGIFSGSSHTQKLALQWLPCQAPGVIGSALGLVGPVSVYCDWVR